jgi:PDZ domain-containing protein
MQSSQDYAVAVALRELGYDVGVVPVVSAVVTGLPADGALSVGDRILAVDGEPTKTSQDVGKAVRRAGLGEPVEITVRRAGREESYPLTPVEVAGEPRIGIEVGEDYSFPFDVSINISEDIGGPSAGLMFSLAVYDTLTPGSLTGGEIVAGTGEIAPDGRVGPIGGIEQKIVGASDAGAELFLVPADNCPDALGAENDDVTLVRVATFADAKEAIEAWVLDEDADLPSCEDGE